MPTQTHHITPKSSSIAGFATHIPDEGFYGSVLVEFKSGKKYVYYDVPEATINLLDQVVLFGQSVGAAISQELANSPLAFSIVKNAEITVVNAFSPEMIAKTLAAAPVCVTSIFNNAPTSTFFSV